MKNKFNCPKAIWNKIDQERYNNLMELLENKEWVIFEGKTIFDYDVIAHNIATLICTNEPSN